MTDEANGRPSTIRPRGKGGPTISDVARVAGVSAMTVSRVINGLSSVRSEKKDAVRAAIAQLSYEPNSAARHLAGVGQLRLGLLYSNPSSGFLSEFLLGALRQSARTDVQMTIEECEPGQDEIAVARHLAATGIEGVILPPPICESAEILEVFRESGIAAVSVATSSSGTDASVSIDDRDAALTMTRHILSLGHRRIGFVLGDPALSATGLRLEGYRTGLAEAGIAPDDRLVVAGLYTYRSGLDAAEHLLDLDEPPTAIFCSNDDMAAATVAVAHRRGFDVPGDLTVCGFDDTVLSTAIWPELTTIRQPIAAMTRLAVDMLVQRFRKGPGTTVANRHQQVDYALIRRQSDAVPRQRPKAK